MSAPNLTTFSPESFKACFPLLSKSHPDLVYLDNAATTQKPQAVLDALQHFYTYQNANIHRANHRLGALATEAFENARSTVKKWINAEKAENVIFTSGTTEGINLLSYCLAHTTLKPGDEMIVSEMEHHANLVPWLQVAKQLQLTIRWLPCLRDCTLDLETLPKLINNKTRLITCTHISNTLGTINPIKQITKIAKQHKLISIIDGAQAVAHHNIDMQDLDCDFYVFSAHKAFGPTGLGILYGKEERLQQLPPYQTGGDMVEEVSFNKALFQPSPFRFEAGTPNIADAVAFGATIDFINQWPRDQIIRHEHSLLQEAKQRLNSIPYLTLVHPNKDSEAAPILSFVIDDIHPSDIGEVLNAANIAVRTGYHCTQPLLKKWGLPGTVRVSFAPYNTMSDIDKLEQALLTAIDILN